MEHMTSEEGEGWHVYVLLGPRLDGAFPDLGLDAAASNT